MITTGAPAGRGFGLLPDINRYGVATLVAALLFVMIGSSAPRADGTMLMSWRGDSVIPFTLDSLAGERTGPAAYPGRVVLLHFFATWCEPCRDELRALQHFAERMAGQGVSVLALDVGEVDARVRRFFSTDPVSFPILLDRDMTVAKSWKVDALPTTVVLDRDHVPRLVAEGDLDWDRPEVAAAILALAAPDGPVRPNPPTR